MASRYKEYKTALLTTQEKIVRLRAELTRYQTVCAKRKAEADADRHAPYFTPPAASAHGRT